MSLTNYVKKQLYYEIYYFFYNINKKQNLTFNIL